MRFWRHSNRVEPGQLLWLELKEIPDRLLVAIRVHARHERGAEVEILASDQTLIIVDYDRLYEEVAP